MSHARAPDPRDASFRTNGAGVLLSRPRSDEWIRLEGQKRHALLEADCSEALHISTMEDLKENLHEMPDRYNIRQLPGFVSKLEPVLQNLKFFTDALTSASQYSPIACLVWGGIQAIVEVRDTQNLTQLLRLIPRRALAWCLVCQRKSLT